MLEKMIEACKKQSELSYSPYSNYKVSAAILMKNGDIVSGINIENCSYPLSICAERCALFSAMSKGYKKDDMVSIMIYTPRLDSMPYPCGACRQVMSELLNKNAQVIIINDKLEPEYHTVEELLPYSFSKDSL